MAETHPLRTLDKSITGDKDFQEWNRKAEALAKSCKSVEMPCLDHLKLADYSVVYEPSEDTYLLLDGLGVALQQKIILPKDTMRVLEIGCGTGVGSIFLTKQLLSLCTKVECHVTDVNPDAIRVTMATAEANHIPSSCMHSHLCDLATPLLGGEGETTTTTKMDVILFNPPYVPTLDEDVGSNSIEASWAGGTDGRIVLDRAFPQIQSLLSYPDGVAFIIVVDDNKPYEINQLLQTNYSLRVEPLVRRKERNEFLTLLKVTHIVK